MASLCKKGDRVKCQAARFDEGSEDRSGERFSVRRAAAGNGTWCFGVIAHARALASNPIQTHRVKHDDGESHKSMQSHLFPESLDGDSDGESEAPSAENQAEEDDADDNRDGVVTDSDDEVDPHGLDGSEMNEAMEIGDSKVVGDRTWVRVKSAPGDAAKWRKKEPGGTRARHRALNDDAREVDVRDDLLPTSHEFILDVAQCRADQANDKRPHTRNHVNGFLARVHRGAQFKEGTGLWAAERVGMTPPPNFGRHLDKRRFTNVLRRLKEGPGGCEDDAGPWHSARFMVGGQNGTWRRNFQWGWSAVIDETTLAWRGKGGAGGTPHLSYVPRKPEDLGCELKTVHDGTSGVMMHVEMQEGKTRMAREQCHQQRGATTSCALRCFKESGLAEAHRRPEECGLKTIEALEKELGTRFLGPVKTNTSGFPIEATRHTLHGTERGASVVMEERDDEDKPTDVHVIGWNGRFYKARVTNHGSAEERKQASKKRQRTDGRNHSMGVDRPKQLERHCDVVEHHKTWKTKSWATRVQLEVFGASLVDSCLACRRLMPKWRDRDGTVSNFMAFVAVLTDQIDARSEAELDIEAASSAKEAGSLLSPVQVFTACAHESVGRNGVRSDGSKHTKQQRCDLCIKAGRKEPNGSGSWRTSWRCRAHPDVRVCKSRDRPCMAEHLANVASGSQHGPMLPPRSADFNRFPFVCHLS
jgi:hypothetical protein